MTKEELLQVFQDFSEQYGETYEERCIYDNNFGDLADVLLKQPSSALDRIAAEKHELEKQAWYNDGVVIGLRICKELWAQGTISYEQLRENELHYLEELKSVREKIDQLENQKEVDND